MEGCFYHLLDESAAGVDRMTARVRSTEHTTGPWAAGLQHAGPPSALLARAVRRLGGLPARALPARLSFDILSPVPVADLVVTARTLRPGRRVALAEATLAAADAPDRPVMALRAWLLRQAEPPIDGLPDTLTHSPAPSGPHDLAPCRDPTGGTRATSMRSSGSGWRVRSRRRVPPPSGQGWPWTWSTESTLTRSNVWWPSPTPRVGSPRWPAPRTLLFVNTDLTLHLTREPVGEEIWMRAQTTVDAAGIGRTTGELGDHGGAVAHSAQCLFVEPRT